MNAMEHRPSHLPACLPDSRADHGRVVRPWSSLLLLCLVATSACTTELDADDPLALDEGSGGGDELGLDEGAFAIESSEPSSLTASVQPAVSLACTQDNDCRVSCLCLGGWCGPNPGVGPQPPAGYCDEPPTRSCSSALDCRDGCICSGGFCSGGVSPQPPDCHLPPPDAYEYDDTWPNWSAYAAPQAHSFHTSTDTDWAAVYIAEPGQVRFETLGLAHGADTRLEIYAWDGVTKGALLGAHDDVGGWYWDPQSKRSRVDLSVGPNSQFLIKVINESDPTIYTSSHVFPIYTLQLSYL